MGKIQGTEQLKANQRRQVIQFSSTSAKFFKNMKFMGTSHHTFPKKTKSPSSIMWIIHRSSCIWQIRTLILRTISISTWLTANSQLSKIISNCSFKGYRSSAATQQGTFSIKRSWKKNILSIKTYSKLRHSTDMSREKQLILINLNSKKPHTRVPRPGKI